MSLGDKIVWSFGEAHMTNEDDEVIWSFGEPYLVIDTSVGSQDYPISLSSGLNEEISRFVLTPSAHLSSPSLSIITL